MLLTVDASLEAALSVASWITRSYQHAALSLFEQITGGANDRSLSLVRRKLNN
jgi:hypothetical protein